MNKTAIYHVCLSSHDEVMFRSADDLNMGFNCLATAAMYTESRLFAEGFMTTHYHYLLQTTSVREVMQRTRYAYTRYFNAKYGRKGGIGEKKPFCLEIQGLHHTIAALNYVIRQGLHHGLAATPFGYPYCSANAYFRSDLGKACPPLMRECNRYKYLPANVKVPATIRMSADGALLREDVLDVAWVEQNYISPRSFLFQMSKVTDEKDIQKQKDENSLPPVTMEAIETGVPDFSLKEAKDFEYGKVNRSNMTDLELCALIDGQLIPKLFKEKPGTSLYLIPEARRAELCEALWRKCREARWGNGTKGVFANKFVTEFQLRRCLCIKESSAK